MSWMFAKLCWCLLQIVSNVTGKVDIKSNYTFDKCLSPRTGRSPLSPRSGGLSSKLRPDQRAGARPGLAVANWQQRSCYHTDHRYISSIIIRKVSKIKEREIVLWQQRFLLLFYFRYWKRSREASIYNTWVKSLYFYRSKTIKSWFVDNNCWDFSDFVINSNQWAVTVSDKSSCGWLCGVWWFMNFSV